VHSMRIVLATTTMLALSGTAAAAAQTGERELHPVRVQLSDGHTLTGFVDVQTSSEHLVLRFEGYASRLWRRIAWEQVERAGYRGKRLSREELQDIAASIATEQIPLDRWSRRKAGGSGEAVAAQETYAERAAAALNRPAVHSIAVHARAANWDADVEVDGLLLHLYPISAHGQVVPADGTLTVELVAARPSAARSRRTQPRGAPLPQIARWTKSLDSHDAGPNGAVFRLPFQAVHPEFRTGLASHGLVRATLTVPGDGVFQATDEWVRIRPFSPLRDRLQHIEGSRFFPGEKQGRTQ